MHLFPRHLVTTGPLMSALKWVGGVGVARLLWSSECVSVRTKVRRS